MNLVETIPELRAASLNGIPGLGYAEVIPTMGKLENRRGVILFDANVDASRLPTDRAVFEGVVYKDGEEGYEAFSVDILLVQKDEVEEPGVTFIAS